MGRCPNCQADYQNRELISVVYSEDRCPQCRHVVSISERVVGQDVAAIILEDIAEIDTILHEYESDTGHQVKKREPRDEMIRWSLGSSHSFALECQYNEKRLRYVTVRMISKIHGEKMYSTQKRLADEAAEFGLQPFIARVSHQEYQERPEIEHAWGMDQILGTYCLSVRLLKSVATRINEAMEHALTSIIGSEDL